MNLNLPKIHKNYTEIPLKLTICTYQFLPKLSPKILKIVVNLYQLRYCVNMIQIFKLRPRLDTGDYDVIKPYVLLLLSETAKYPVLFNSTTEQQNQVNLK